MKQGQNVHRSNWYLGKNKITDIKINKWKDIKMKRKSTI